MATDSTCLKRLWCSIPLLLVWGLLLVAPAYCDQDPAAVSVEEFPVDLVMFHDPQLYVGRVTLTLPNELKELWLKAIDRGDSELQRLAADSFTLAHDRGMKNLEDTHARLADLLTVPKQDSTVHRAAVHTLVHLDARDYAGLLAEVAKKRGLTTAMLVEPALARWNSDLMKDEWLSRIDDPRASLAARLLAIDGLGETEEVKAVSSLTRIAIDLKTMAKERMAAARALSKVGPPGLVGVARSLVDPKSQPTLLNNVLALELVNALDSPDAIELLTGLVSHESTTIQSGALQRLYAIDPKHVHEFAESAITSKDAGVRTVGANTLIIQKQVKLIAPLATLLNDVNPTLRRHVAKAMVQLGAEPELHQEVISQATAVLNKDAWRGIEQAIIVLVLLDHKPTGVRLVELMPYSRPEVMNASAWGLRRLAVKEHLPAMLARANILDVKIRAGDPEEVPGLVVQLVEPGVEHQIAQLFMAFGKMGYKDAESLIATYIPKDFILGNFSRAAAVWSVGWMQEGKAPAKLTKQLITRLSDTMGMEPEVDYVRRMCAISLARMKSQSAVPALRRFSDEDSEYIQRSCLWALEELTGEVSPPTRTFPHSFSDWFLVPVK